MDPISAIGTAAAVTQLANYSVSILVKMYTFEINYAPKRSKELRDEMGTVHHLLNLLEKILTSPERQSFTLLQSLTTAIFEFRDMLADMAANVNGLQVGEFRRLNWPFTQSENERFLLRIERYKAIFNLALSIDNT
jgi:hypothetical protein